MLYMVHEVQGYAPAKRDCPRLFIGVHSCKKKRDQALAGGSF